MNKHYGKLISKVVRAKGHSLHSVASHLAINKETVRNWFNQPKLELYVVENIGKVIVHDFQTDFPELYLTVNKDDVDSVEVDAVPVYGIDNTDYIKSQHHIGLRDDIGLSWKEKYIILLEKYNARLLEALNDKSKLKKKRRNAA